MESHPDAGGYLFMQDDVVVNFWNFPVRHDFSKVWRALIFADPDPEVWHQHGNISLNTDISGIPPVARFWFTDGKCAMKRVIDFVNGFSLEERQRLYNTNSDTGQPTIRMANSDFFYIPSRFREMVLPHLKRAHDHLIVTEVAMPIIFDAVLERDDYEELIGAALYRVKATTDKIALYDPCWDYFHKIKSTVPEQFQWLVETIFRYGPMTGKWDCLGSGASGLTSYDRIRDSWEGIMAAELEAAKKKKKAP